MNETIFSPRLLAILKVLTAHNDYVSTHVLADELGVSNRTIFREVQNTNILLEPFSLALESKAGFGYKLVGKEADIIRLIKTLETSYNTLPYRNVQERREMLMIECLQRQSITKLSVLAQTFGVSEGTISRDLDAIEPWLANYGLVLLRRQGHGVEIQGDEEQVRKAITDYVHNQLAQKDQGIEEMYKSDVLQYFQKQESGILGLIDQDIIIRVIEVLENSSINIVKQITEHSYIGLIIHLAVAVERIRNGDAISMHPYIMDSLKQEPMVREAKIIATDIEDSFNIKFPEAEVGYILMHLRGTRPRYLSDEGINDTVSSNYDCMVMAESLIRRFSNLMGEDFSQDEALLVGLMAHLKPTINRLHYQLEIRNPLLNEIKEQYNELFEIIKETASILYLEHNYRISDDEIGYLTLHFGASLERKKHSSQVHNSLNLGVVCASGIGISTLLASKLKSTFLDAGSVIPLSVEEVEGKVLEHIDLLVATLEVTSNVPIIYVNPLLRNEDILLIRKEMDLLKASSNRSEKQISDKQYNWDIIEQIKCLAVDLAQTKDVVLESIVKTISNDQSYQEAILKEIAYREKRSPVIIEEKRFVMYHAGVEGLNFPEVIFFYHKGDKHHQDYQDIDIGVFMIIPKPAEALDRKTMSKISEAIIDSEDLTKHIKTGNNLTIINDIKAYIKEKDYD